jgi:hypothetical protein
LLLSATCTDGGANSLDVFINGVRLVTTGIDPVTDQGNDVQYYDLTPFLDLLQPGTNTLAVILNNVWQPTWDDVAFDLSLKTAIYAPVTASINTFHESTWAFWLPQTASGGSNRVTRSRPRPGNCWA